MKIYHIHSKISVCFNIVSKIKVNINNQSFFLLVFTQTGKMSIEAKLNDSKYI